MSAARSPWRVTRVLPLIPGESLDGYVARVAAAHHIPRMALVTEVTGEIRLRRPNASFCNEMGLDTLADCFGISPGSIRLHSPEWSPDAGMLSLFGMSIPRHFLQFSCRRFSPQALSISAHHRGLWQVRQLPICTETWEYLEELCPNPACRSRQIWRRTPGIDLCEYCAEPLTRAQAVPVPKSLREGLEMLVGLIHHDPDRRRITRRHLPSSLAELDGGHLFELACVLAPVVNRRAAALLTPKSLCLESARKIVVPAIAATWPFLAGWPVAIEQHVADKLNAGETDKGGSTRKAFYQVLCDRDNPRLSPPVRKVLCQIVERCRAASSQGVTIVEMARLTGADRPTLFRMRQAGKLPSFLALDGIRLKVLVNREAVVPMLVNKKPRLRLVHAAELLGVPTYTIRELVHLDLVEAAGVPLGRGDHFQLAVSQDSLRGFLETLSRRLALIHDMQSISLAEVMRRIGGRPKPWAQVLKAIVDGKLLASAAHGQSSLIQRIMINSGDIASTRYLESTSGINWGQCLVTKSDLADMMNIKAPHFSRHSDFLLGPGPEFREISMEMAKHLARTYISMPEMGRKLNLNGRAISAFAQSNGVKPLASRLFSRAEAEQRIPGLLGS